jgi:hypothetical protein
VGPGSNSELAIRLASACRRSVHRQLVRYDRTGTSFAPRARRLGDSRRRSESPRFGIGAAYSLLNHPFSSATGPRGRRRIPLSPLGAALRSVRDGGHRAKPTGEGPVRGSPHPALALCPLQGRRVPAARFGPSPTGTGKSSARMFELLGRPFRRGPRGPALGSETPRLVCSAPTSPGTPGLRRTTTAPQS